ncbi:hypothetical protein [Micromonospora sp. NPDC023888]|uniref:Rv0361 family membrane protein n=1 Tax=Micromonospora sp. NPDC023888 TaxID=3155607 RepID=UPI00340681B6
MTYEPMMVPTPKPNRTARTALIVVSALLALCCVVGVGVGFWIYRTLRGDVEPARAAATAYVDDMRSGNYPGAYGRLCADVRKNITEADFARIQAAQLPVSSYEIIDVNVTNYNGRVTATAIFEMVQEGTGARFTQTMLLVKKDDEWLVCQ